MRVVRGCTQSFLLLTGAGKFRFATPSGGVLSSFHVHVHWPTNHHVLEGLPNGATLIPIISASFINHLTNFSAEKNNWSVDLAILNRISEVQNHSKNLAMVIVALYLIPPQFTRSVTDFRF